MDESEGCTEVVLFPPFPFISKVKDIVAEKGITVGAQQVYYEDKGAFTGSVAASMVKSVGCEYVLCGHSERRTLFSDSDVNINAKVKKVSYQLKRRSTENKHTQLNATKLLRENDGRFLSQFWSKG